MGVGIVVAAITYASLIVGELVPKQIALRNREAVAVRVAPAMTVLAKVASPLVWLLDASGNLSCGCLGSPGSQPKRSQRRKSGRWWRRLSTQAFSNPAKKR